MKKSSQHLRFAVLAADTVLFTMRDGELLVRLITVNRPPYFKNTSGFPGGLLLPRETAEHAAKRHIEEKAGIRKSVFYLEQLYTFSGVNRDPRGRVVAVAHLALVPWENLSREERENRHDTYWCSVKKMPRLAYDHNEMLGVALARLRSRVTYTTLIGKLMPKEFTFTELEEGYEIILGKNLDKRNFRKKIEKLNLLKPLSHMRAGTPWRPAKLYSWRKVGVEEMPTL